MEASWTAVNTDLPDLKMQSLAISPGYANDQTLFAGNSLWCFRLRTGVILESRAGLPTLLWILWYFPGFANDQTVYAGANNVVYISTDGGTSWEDVSPSYDLVNALADIA